MLNRIIIMGRLTRDPELRHTQSGVAVASFTVAVDRDFRDKTTGEKSTDFIDVVAWRQTGEFVSKYFAKGRMAVVEGRLQLRDWTDKEGNKRRNAEIVAENVYFGESKREAEGSGYGGGSYGSSGGSYGGAAGGRSYSKPASAPGADYGLPAEGDQFSELADDDGELPF